MCCSHCRPLFLFSLLLWVGWNHLKHFSWAEHSEGEFNMWFVYYVLCVCFLLFVQSFATLSLAFTASFALLRIFTKILLLCFLILYFFFLQLLRVHRALSLVLSFIHSVFFQRRLVFFLFLLLPSSLFMLLLFILCIQTSYICFSSFFFLV